MVLNCEIPQSCRSDKGRQRVCQLEDEIGEKAVLKMILLVKLLFN